MNTKNIRLVKTLSFCLTAAVLLTGCNEVAVNTHSQIKASDMALTEGTPWATTALYRAVDGIADRSKNYIGEPEISNGTISSAQYRNGMFMFVSMLDYTRGDFDLNSLSSSIDAVAGEFGQPQGFSYGDFEVITDSNSNLVRRIRNASFAPSAVIDRNIVKVDNSEFTYSFVAGDGFTYHVEHKPYQDAFSDVTFPAELTTAIDGLFDAKLSDDKLANHALTSNAPWVTTAIYQQVNGAPDFSINYIDDPSISSGTISSAQYRDGNFLFISMIDYQTGEFNVDALTTSLDAVTLEGQAPQGFATGDFEMVLDDSGKPIRRITNASFAPTATIDRLVTVATEDEFTYLFTAGNGSNYYVEHKPYQLAFTERDYPETLQNAVDRYFAAQ